MKSKVEILFLKKDIFRVSLPIFWGLSLISGFSIIWSKNYLSGPFRVDNIYAMFSTISSFMLMYLSVSLFGKEFQYKTINMIRISNRSPLEIIIRKLIVMVVAGLITSLLSFLEVLVEQLYFGHTEVNLINLLGRLTLSYFVYCLFLFSVGSIIVFLLKNTLFSFICILLFLRIGVTFMNILSNFSTMRSFVQYIPLSFAETSFSFANYTGKQMLVMVLWSFVFLSLTPLIYKKRGYE
ncbi:ABC transporter permease [Pseudolactococcus carnosus]|uniref:ABC transporter permease n=1 Tax=Pseudolactococcus carnosus TaxID=2749961 RepID=UPI00081274A0|nr:ABC transporter permease [Lactococcus carnosus]SCA92778.1 conserved membrane hypothetical protein containing permease domain [Lactococcus piscium]MCJ1970192.1 ABC transporter permease [Lactococcus carnosus]MCJ1973867.1 ABC transporter permease [Lactococcus carnosus]MCJ1974868.1 ABC transporter permease [Lactococcus carnosus]MCJ1979542.1 ABC transporter permease [Lactococcus carnosus]